jgi:uncharacterized protein YndB with AHSA1/START domain
MAVSTAKTSASSNPMEREVILTRIFNAPRELVFRAWTEREHLIKWWGPGVFTNPVCEIDLRLGGAWRIVMRGPDGTDYPCGGVYREIVEPERLVFTNIAMDAQGNRLLDGLTTVIFDDLGGKTKLTLVTRAVGLVPLAPQMLAGMEAGWSQSLDKLEQLISGDSATAQKSLTITLPSDLEILMTRVFHAPRSLVFEALSKPEHVARWWGPRNTSLSVCEIDFRVGGAWRYVLQTPAGSATFKGVFLEITPPQGLVSTEIFDEPKVGCPEWTTTVTLEEHDGKTTLTSRVLHKSVENRNGHLYSGMEAGASETYDRLAGLLDSLAKS